MKTPESTPTVSIRGASQTALDASEAQAAQKLHAALPANPRAEVRPMELLWIVLAFFLLAMYLDATDVNQYVIAEKAKLAECNLAKERSRQYATALTTLLNEKPIVIGETTRVNCKVREIAS